ncbi:MAG: CorA family divalent cation transporter [Actinomycetales bacterium]
MKNSQLGGHRPRHEYLADARRALAEFARAEGHDFEFHDTVEEALGLASGEQVVDHDGLFVSPFPFLHSHGSYLCGLLATPTSVADGNPEFTSLFVVATPTQLLTVILDPPTTYAGPFGQRLLNRRETHLLSNTSDVGESLLMVLRDNVTSLNFGLRELTQDVEHYEEVLRNFSRTKRSDLSAVLGIIESYLLKLRVEIGSLRTVVTETARIVETIADNSFAMECPVGVFDRRHEITARNLAMQAARTVAIRDRLERDIAAMLDKCEQLRDKVLVDATHWFGAMAALLLVPSLIVGFYGQNVSFPERHWAFGHGFSTALVIGLGAALYAYFKRRGWL